MSVSEMANIDAIALKQCGQLILEQIRVTNLVATAFPGP